MSMRKIIKGSLISLAVLGMIGGSVNGNIANAKHRHARYTRRIHHIRRNHKRGKLYRHRVWLYGRGKITPHYKWVYSRSRKGYSHHARHIRRSYKRHARKHYAKSRAGFHFNPKLDKESKSDRAYDEYVYHKNYLPILKKFDQLRGGYYSMNSKAYDRYIDQISNAEGVKDDAKQKKEFQKEVADMKSRTFHDINQDRAENDVSPLTETPDMDAVANMRTAPSQDHMHIDPNTGNGYAEEDAYKLGYDDDPSNEIYGENIDSSDSGSGSYSEDGVSYDPNNGKEMADACNDSMMNHDADSNWGHRENILNPNYSTVGIGVRYTPNSYGEFHLIEDFK